MMPGPIGQISGLQSRQKKKMKKNLRNPQKKSLQKVQKNPRKNLQKNLQKIQMLRLRFGTIGPLSGLRLKQKMEMKNKKLITNKKPTMKKKL